MKLDVTNKLTNNQSNFLFSIEQSDMEDAGYSDILPIKEFRNKPFLRITTYTKTHNIIDSNTETFTSKVLKLYTHGDGVYETAIYDYLKSHNKLFYDAKVFNDNSILIRIFDNHPTLSDVIDKKELIDVKPIEVFDKHLSIEG